MGASMYLSAYTSVFVFTSVIVKLGFLSRVPILLGHSI